ncbi:E3 ubiquitin-protein ligase SINA-like 8 [Lolium perenne]|uniref:E3 ubiquitin-protein ligase SINA-like 8 n=1 Tax=Lolium perenne TaxID=4522 RepID=UPI0021EAC940|nr:E3 ubiquitin-protein ligase SINA-like 8 [Lolium perenne]
MAEEVASKRIKTEKDHGAGPEPDGVAAEGGRSDGEIFVKIQSELLRCRICLEPLKPPVFKCEAGHVLCSVCMEKLREVGSVLGLGIFCDVCRKNTSYCRCVELEQVIDAIKVPCSNQTYGCNESIIYHEKEKHETECTHAPCYCPENDCDFRGGTCCLLDHFVTAHGWSPTNFSYNKPLKISVARDHRFTLLVGEDQTIFLLTNTLTEIGSAITMVCVRPHESEPSYSCNISAAQVVAGGKAEGRLVFQKDPLVSSSSLVGGVQLGKFFLLVPPELADSSSGELTLHIRVDRLAP